VWVFVAHVSFWSAVWAGLTLDSMVPILDNVRLPRCLQATTLVFSLPPLAQTTFRFGCLSFFL
jgi:hypothetical protein